jgi:hypothetical protein
LDDDPATVELDHPTPHRVDDAAVVGGHDDGGPGAVDPVEQLHDAHRGGRVEVAGGLVRQEDQRPVDEGPGDRDALLLATGELVRHGLLLATQTHQLEDLRHRFADGRLRPADRLEREGHVLRDGLVRQQLEVLEHAADVAAQVRDLVAGQRGDVLAGDVDLALLGGLLTVEEAQEGRLAGARRSDQEDELALVDVDRCVAQGHVLALVDLRDVLEFDHDVLTTWYRPPLCF